MHISIDVYIQNKFFGKYGFNDFFTLKDILGELSLESESYYKILLSTRSYYTSIKNEPDYSTTTLSHVDINKLKILIKESTNKYSWRGGYILYINKITIYNNKICVIYRSNDKSLKYEYLSQYKKFSQITIGLNKTHQVNQIIDSNENNIEYTQCNGLIIISPPFDNVYIVELNCVKKKDNKLENAPVPIEEKDNKSENRIHEPVKDNNSENQINEPLLPKKNFFSRMFNLKSKSHIN